MTYYLNPETSSQRPGRQMMLTDISLYRDLNRIGIDLRTSQPTNRSRSVAIFGCGHPHHRNVYWTRQTFARTSLLGLLAVLSQRTDYDPQADIIVTVTRPVIVAVGGAAIITIVVPRAASKDPE